MIIGPLDTPYEGGFFHFLVRCPPNYPINPPRWIRNLSIFILHLSSGWNYSPLATTQSGSIPTSTRLARWKEDENIDWVQMWATGVSFNPGHLGRTFLEPCTLPLLTPHLHSGAGFHPVFYLILLSHSLWWRTSRIIMSQDMKRRDLVETLRGEWPMLGWNNFSHQVQSDNPARNLAHWSPRWLFQRISGVKMQFIITPLLTQTTWSGGQGKVARPFSYRQRRPSPALSTISRKCAPSTCTGANLTNIVFQKWHLYIYVNVGQGWWRDEGSLWWAKGQVPVESPWWKACHAEGEQPTVVCWGEQIED